MSELNGKNGHQKPKQTRKVGRPTVRNEALARTILDRIAEGESLNRICKSGIAQYSMVCRWLFDDKEFQEKYVQAKALCAEKYADEIVDIADDGENDTYTDGNGNQRTDHDVVQRSRLRVDARKWVASKLLPKVYGDAPVVVNNNDNRKIIVLPESKLLQLQERHKELLEAV